MNRSTRDKFASGTDQTDLTTGNAVWQTAPAIWKQLAADYGPFDLDLTGDTYRALLPKWFGPGSTLGTDALVAPWHAHGQAGYSNPPYGRFVQLILEKARFEADHGFRSLFLLPLRVTKAFRQHILHGASDLIFPDKRLTFFENGLPRCGYDKRGKVRADPALFDSILVQYQSGWWDSPRLSEWKVPAHVSQADLDRWVALNPYPEWLDAQKRKAA